MPATPEPTGEDAPDSLVIDEVEALDPTMVDGAIFRINRVLFRNFDGHDQAQFTEVGAPYSPRFHQGARVVIHAAGVLIFDGRIASVAPMQGAEGNIHAYVAYGCEFWANRLAIVDPVTGQNRMVYNADPDDSESVVSRNFLRIGEILLQFIVSQLDRWSDEHITGYYESEFLDMQTYPRKPVVFQGLGPVHQIRDVIGQYAGDHLLCLDGDGKLRVFRPEIMNGNILEWQKDINVGYPAVTRDASGCFTAVKIWGGQTIRAAWLSLNRGELSEKWAPSDEATWKLVDFASAGDGNDDGLIDEYSTISLTTHDSDPTRHWPADYWYQRRAIINLKHIIMTDGADAQLYTQRRIIGNTAMAPGGQCTITLDEPIDVTTVWDHYVILGATITQGNVYRLYHVEVPPIVDKMVTYSPIGIAVTSLSGTSNVLYHTPQGIVVGDGGIEYPATIQVLVDDGDIRFYEPVVKWTDTPERLRVGNPGIHEPADVRALVFWNEGNLSVRVPEDEDTYEGTAFSEDNIRAVYEEFRDDWVYPADRTIMRDYARMLLNTFKDTVREMSLTYNALIDGFERPDFTISINYPPDMGPDAFDMQLGQLKIPVRSREILWTETDASGGMAPRSMIFHCSNRLRFATAPDNFVHSGPIDLFAGVAGRQIAEGGVFAGLGPPSFTEFEPLGYGNVTTGDATGARNAFDYNTQSMAVSAADRFNKPQDRRSDREKAHDERVAQHKAERDERIHNAAQERNEAREERRAGRRDFLDRMSEGRGEQLREDRATSRELAANRWADREQEARTRWEDAHPSGMGEAFPSSDTLRNFAPVPGVNDRPIDVGAGFGRPTPVNPVPPPSEARTRALELMRNPPAAPPQSPPQPPPDVAPTPPGRMDAEITPEPPREPEPGARPDDPFERMRRMEDEFRRDVMGGE